MADQGAPATPPDAQIAYGDPPLPRWPFIPLSTAVTITSSFPPVNSCEKHPKHRMPEYTYMVPGISRPLHLWATQELCNAFVQTSSIR